MPETPLTDPSIPQTKEVSRDALIYLLNNATTTPANNKSSYGDFMGPRILMKDYAMANGTNQSSGINAACALAASLGLPVEMEGATYGMGAGFDPSLSHVRLIGVPGKTVIKKLNAGSTAAIFPAGRYYGWYLSGIEIDGNRAAVSGLPPEPSMNLQGARNMIFEKCAFRELNQAITISGRGLLFRDNRFLGVRAGLMQSGVQNPTPVATAVYTNGLKIEAGSEDILIENNDFHFLNMALEASGGSASGIHPVKNIITRGNRFRADYWRQPYITLRKTVTGYDNATRILTVAAGGLTGFFTDSEFISFGISIATGAGFSFFASTFTPTTAASNVRKGDVIETASGYRAEILRVVSTTSFITAGWEAIDTFEPAATPSSGAWEIKRYYAAPTLPASIGGTQTDTTTQLWSPLINPYTGELMVDHAGLDPIGRSFESFAKHTYGGTHFTWAEDCLFEGNRYRGMWADMCSNFDGRAIKIISNFFEYGNEEDITVTRVPGSTIHGNTHKYSGASGLFLSSENCSVMGNTYSSWGCANRGFVGRGAVEVQGKENSVVGNTFDYDRTTNFGGQSAYAVSFYLGDSAGSVVSDNTGSGRVGQVWTDDDTPGVHAGLITVRDFYSIDGDSREQVIIGNGEIFSLRNRVTEHFKLEDVTGSKYGVVLANNGAVTFAAGKVGNGAVFGGANYLSSPDNQLFRMGNHDFEFTGWFKLTSLTDGYIFAKQSGGPSAFEYGLVFQSGSNRPLWQVSNGTSITGVGADSFGALSTATWYFFRCGFDKLSGRIFVQINNGATDSVAQSGGALIGADPFGLGARGDGFLPIAGMVDEFSVWKHHRLNTDDTAKIYNSGNGRAWPLL